MLKNYAENIIINYAQFIISENEGIPANNLKVAVCMGCYFLTDGNRMFKIKIHNAWVKFVLSHQNDLYFELADNGLRNEFEMGDDSLLDISYREVFSKNFKVYLSNDEAEYLVNEGFKVHKTLNGSRTKYNKYIIVSREEGMKSASIIYEFRYPDHVQNMIEKEPEMLVTLKENGVDIYNKEEVKRYFSQKKGA